MADRIRKITDRQARSIKPDSKPIPTGITGLVLRPAANKGRGQWVLRFVSPATKKRRELSLGIFPDISVADALGEGQQARALIAKGIDPIEQRRNRTSIPTFEQAAIARWEQVAPTFKNAKHRAQWIASLGRHVLPTIGHIPVDQLAPRHFADALQKSWLNIPETASRMLARCYNIMAAQWALEHIEANPVDAARLLLPKQPASKAHHPAMPWQLIPAFVREHLSGRLTGARAALLFLILNASRSGEVRGATWGEINLAERLWVIPADRMKANALHRVPLSEQAIQLLTARLNEPDQLIFPGRPGGQLSDMALTSLLRKAKAASDVPGRVATAHGFRSSFKNWAVDQGYGGSTSERQLAHVIGNKTRAAYERSDQLERRREMMQRWADFIVEGR